MPPGPSETVTEHSRRGYYAPLPLFQRKQTQCAGMAGERNPKELLCDDYAKPGEKGEVVGGCPLRGHRALAGAACRRTGRARLRRSRPFGL